MGVCLALSLFSACAEDNNRPDTHTDAPVALLLPSAQIRSEFAATTRAVKELPTTEAIGFFVQADGSYYKEANNIEGSFQSGAWQAKDAAKTIWLNNKDAKIGVYHPYSAAQTAAQALNLAAAGYDAAKDLSATCITVNNRADMTTLSATLTHVYSRLSLTFLRNAGYTGDAKMSAVSLSAGNLFGQGTYNPVTGVYALNNSTVNYPDFSATPKDVTDKAESTASFDWLLPPTKEANSATDAALSGDLTVTVTVDGKAMRVAIPKEKFTGSRLGAGTHHSVTIYLQPTGLTLNSVKITDWVAVDVDGGNAGFVPDVP